MQKYELSLKCQNVTAGEDRDGDKERDEERGDYKAEGINKTQEADRDRDEDERRVWD